MLYQCLYSNQSYNNYWYYAFTNTKKTVHFYSEFPRGTQYKRPYRDVLQTWVEKSASWYINDPYLMQNLVFWMGHFSKCSQIWGKFGRNLRKFLEKFSNSGQNLAHENCADGFFFLGKLESMINFQIPSSTSLPKPNLSTRPGFKSRVSWSFFLHLYET